MRSERFSAALTMADEVSAHGQEITGSFQSRDITDTRRPVALIVEDDATIAYGLAAEVESRGVEAVVTTSASEALTEIGLKRIAFAIVDSGVGRASDLVLATLERQNIDRLIYSGVPVSCDRLRGADAVLKPGLTELRAWLDKRTGR